MNSIVVLTANFLSLAVVLGGISYGRQNPSIIVYTFILSTFIRYTTLEIFFFLGKWNWSKGLLPYLSSGPARGQKPQLMLQGNKPADPAAYFFVFGFISMFAFILMHATVDRKLNLFWPELEEDMKWSFVYATVYWIKDLVSRSMVVDLGASRTINFGYNSSALGFLTFAVFAAGGLLAYFQTHQITPSPWLVCGPLLAIRHFVELRQDMKSRG